VAVVLLVVAVALFVRAVVAPLRDAAETLESATARTSSLQADIRALDAASPSRVPEDVAAAELADDDMRRYLAVREALAPALHAAAAARGRTWSELGPERLATMRNPLKLFGLVTGAVGGLESVARAEEQLLSAAHAALSAHAMGPTELARLAEIVEWRFLQRPEALSLGLTEWDKAEHARHRFSVDFMGRMLDAKEGPFRMGERDRRNLERQVEASREALATLEAEARQRTALTAGTRAGLEGRRADLERWGPEGVDLLGTLGAQRGPLTSLFGGSFPMPAGGRFEWTVPSTDDAPGQPR
jgi:hypothetical protein